MQYQFLFNPVNAFKITSKGILFNIKVKPSAKTNTLKEYIVINNCALFKIEIKSPAIKGKANKELITLLANVLKIKKEAIFIKGGLTSNNKLIEVIKPEDEKAKQILNKIINKT